MDSTKSDAVDCRRGDICPVRVFSRCLARHFTLSTELFIGWLLVFGGVFQLYRTIKAGGHATRFHRLAFNKHPLFDFWNFTDPVPGSRNYLSDCPFNTLFHCGRNCKNRPRHPIASAQQLGMVYPQWSSRFDHGLHHLGRLAGNSLLVLGLLVGINMIFFGISLFFWLLRLPASMQNLKKQLKLFFK